MTRFNCHERLLLLCVCLCVYNNAEEQENLTRQGALSINPHNTTTSIPSSTSQSEAVAQADEEEKYKWINLFLECVIQPPKGNENCRLNKKVAVCIESLDLVVEDCGDSFVLLIDSKEIPCECTEDYLECRRASHRPGRSLSVCHRLSRILGELLATPSRDCVEGKSQSSASLNTVSQIGTTQSTVFFTQTMITSDLGPPTLATVSTDNSVLIGGVIGGLFGGAVITVSVLILLLIYCGFHKHLDFRRPSVAKLTPNNKKVEDRRALCDSPFDAVEKNYHNCEPTNVSGKFPSAASDEEVTRNESFPSDSHYNHLGEQVSDGEETTYNHSYDVLDRSSLDVSQRVINNNYNHTWVHAEIPSYIPCPNVRLTPVDVSVEKQPPCYTISGETVPPREYFVVEGETVPPREYFVVEASSYSTEPYSTINVADES